MEASLVKNQSGFGDLSLVRRAKKHLSSADPQMAKIIRAVGAFKPGVVKDTFDALVRSIIHQQISMKAGQTIVRRVQQLCPAGRLNATALARASDVKLRQAGLSRQKISYVRSICEHFQNGLIKQKHFAKLSDKEVIDILIDIHGVGVWTAEMILIFNLQRPDVWPVDDLGLRTALQKWYRIPVDAKRIRLTRAGDIFRSYRSIATWYLWRSLGGDIVPGFA